MRARALAAILAAALFVLPAAAGAAKHYSQQPSVAAEIHGTTSNGYRFFLYSADPEFAVFSTSKGVGKVGNVSVSYFDLSPQSRSGADASRLDLKIGKLGHFRGHFVATSTMTRKPSKHCKGEPTTVEVGHFVGSFEFHGERGYTTIDAGREPGSVTHTGAQTCIYPPDFGSGFEQQAESARQAKEEKERQQSEFRLLAGDSKARVLLQASREESPHELHSTPTIYDVTAKGGQAGKFQVDYSASTFSIDPEAPSSFQVPNLIEPLAEATVEPPAPFTGAATFHLDSPMSASWTGDLAVELPGLGKVPLTGGKIAAGLCHGRSHCTKTLPKSLQPLIEQSGSGSGVVAVSVTTTSPQSGS